MNVRVTKKLLQDAGVWKKDSENDNRFSKFSRWGSDTDKFVIDIGNFETSELEKMHKAAKALPEFRSLMRKIEIYREVVKNPEGAKMPHLERLEPALKAFFQKLPNKWIFHEEDDGVFLPYYVLSIKYIPAKRGDYGYPAHVAMEAYYVKRKKVLHDSFNFYAEDLNNSPTAPQLLKKKGYLIENASLVKEFWETIELYKKIKDGIGAQYYAFGRGEAEDGDRDYGGSKFVAMERDERPSKVVMDNDYKNKEDDEENEDERSSFEVSTNYWATKGQKPEVDPDEESDPEPSEEDIAARMVTIPPRHPYVYVFDLQKHRYVGIHVSYLKPYIYDETCGEKLILPKEKKDLVSILVQGGNLLMDDIVQGKTGGIIVLATGLPGTGKTLTAEIYAEAVKKPLYVVQCSQLGISAEDIEKELQLVLNRASRWGAILLIDEADVYVRERGTDIEQNAIVGVFLRVLEYYRGILFFTSNRATILDDAVVSRATAHIAYELPSQKEATKIWKVLAEQFKLKLKGDYESYATKFKNVSGRTIRNLLKLSMLISQREKRPIDLKLVDYAANFLDGVKGEEKKK